jgi:hypothetical protein
LLTSGQSVLDACQIQKPGLTQDSLVNALIGRAPQDLTAAVAVGAISTAQANAALRAQRAQIIAMLTQPRPLVKSAAPGK